MSWKKKIKPTVKICYITQMYSSLIDQSVCVAPLKTHGH